MAEAGSGRHKIPTEVSISIIIALYVIVPILAALFTQRGPLTVEGVLFAVACALPFGLLAKRGHLRWCGKPAFPSVPWLILTCWLIWAEPSMIVIDSEAASIFRFDENSVFWGRVFFQIWLWLCAAIVGRATNRPVHWNLHRLEYLILSVTTLLLFWAAFMSGQLIFYLGLDVATAGSSTSVVTLLAHMFLKVMVGVHTLALLARTSRRHIVSPILFVTLFFVFMSASRRYLFSAVILIVTVLRLNQVRPTLRLIATGAGITVLLLLFVVVYRNQLGIDGDAFWSNPFAVLASSTDVIGQTRDNLSTRWSYGPQLFAAVSNYLASGPALSETWKESAIGALPTFLVPEKAERAQMYAIEFDLAATGRFPLIDLAPTPWMHAVFDYGIIGLLLFACVYGFALRWLDRAFMCGTMTWSRWFFLSCAFYVLAIPDTKLDTVLLDMRDPIWITGLLAIGERAFHRWSSPVRARPIMGAAMGTST